MEGLTIVLSSLLLLGSPSGVLVEQMSESFLGSPFDTVETLQVRIDNAPTHRILRGQAERVRIAGRGMWVTPDFRIAAVDIETDSIDLNLRNSNQDSFSSLEQPLQAGIRIALHEDDINHWLRSPKIANFIRQIGLSSLPRVAAAQLERYTLVNPRITFLDNRVRLQLELQQQPNDELDPLSEQEPLSESFELALVIESGFNIIKGWGLELVDPQILVNQESIPPLVLNLIGQGVREQFDLRSLDDTPALLRLLQIQITPTQLEIAGFLRVQPPFEPSDRPDVEE